MRLAPFSIPTPKLLGFFVVSLGTLLACGGSSEKSSDDGLDGAEASTVECPTIDYCALRCSGEKTPLYPATCPMPDDCPCLKGIVSRKDWSGTYFLEDSSYAANLLLEADGTFRWTVDGCGVQAGDCGLWAREQPNSIELMPSQGHDALGWVDGSTSAMILVADVDDGNDDLVVSLPTVGEKPLAQRWRKGRVCATCSGATESADVQACAEPVAARCR